MPPALLDQGFITMQCTRLAQASFDTLITGAKVLEADSHGAKVYLLADGNILKLFRRKRLLSSALLRPYSARFIANAERLEILKIATLKVLAHYKLERPGMTAVLYEPLPGRNLRQLMDTADFTWQHSLEPLIAMIRRLHRSGVYFRSLHLGNVIVTPEGELGLIDMADMSFTRGPLSRRLIKRNLEHFSRYLEREKLTACFPLAELNKAVLK
jgi:RIO-like serine/threonine protein kinase